MAKIMEIGLGTIAESIFAVHNKGRSLLPLSIRSAFLRIGCWFLEKKFAVRDLGKLQRIIAEENQGMNEGTGDRIDGWSEWE